MKINYNVFNTIKRYADELHTSRDSEYINKLLGIGQKKENMRTKYFIELKNGQIKKTGKVLFKKVDNKYHFDNYFCWGDLTSYVKNSVETEEYLKESKQRNDKIFIFEVVKNIEVQFKREG